MIDILYICDRKACKDCNPDCYYTEDVSHAVNFKKKYFYNYKITYVELNDKGEEAWDN